MFGQVFSNATDHFYDVSKGFLGRSNYPPQETVDTIKNLHKQNREYIHGYIHGFIDELWMSVYNDDWKIDDLTETEKKLLIDNNAFGVYNINTKNMFVNKFVDNIVGNFITLLGDRFDTNNFPEDEYIKNDFFREEQYYPCDEYIFLFQQIRNRLQGVTK
jgi:hypothetical protein